MSQPSETIRYYDDHADEYVRETVNVNMESLYKPFLELLAPAARILDAGCGSGRDAKAFLDRGYHVTAIDASARMVEATAALTGTCTLRMLLEEIDFHDEFDGIWACASLLHVPRNQITDVMSRFAAALQDDGVCYVSFKEGRGDRTEGGRRFTDFTELALTSCLAEQSGFKLLRSWVTDDVRPDRNDRWVNALARKIGG